MLLEFDWPPASLSGHATYSGHKKATATKQSRHAAWAIAKKAGKPSVDLTGDIYLRLTFYPPDNRSDRCNFYNRCKPIFDGIADAWSVNDKRFVPVIDTASYQQPSKPARVTVEVFQ